MSIQLQSINKNFKQFALINLDLEINKGEYFVILGPSGAGKTLILEIIAGLIKPDSGRIHGVSPKKIGFIYQDYMLFPHLNVSENIAYGLKVRKMVKEKIKAVVDDLLAKHNIRHLSERDVSNLSEGEKQRVAIARAMAIYPEILLLDEPTAALDPITRIKTRFLFLNLHRETTSTFIHVTHDFEEAIALADRMAVLLDGRIVQLGKPDIVFNNPINRETADFLGYRNVFGGIVKAGKMKLRDISISVPLENAEFAYIAIRSDDIIISKRRIKSSARNSLNGIVKNIVKSPTLVEVHLDVGVLLAIDITRISFEEMGIKVGDPLWATFKVSSIRIFEH